MCVNIIMEKHQTYKKLNSVENLHVPSLKSDKLLANLISSIPHLGLF